MAPGGVGGLHRSLRGLPSRREAFRVLGALGAAGLVTHRGMETTAKKGGK